MTTARRAVLVAYLLTIAMLCLWVPWKARAPGSPVIVVNIGYAPIWEPPPSIWKKPNLDRAVDKFVDGRRVGFEPLATTALFGIAFLLLPGSQISKPQTPISGARVGTHEASHTK